jgi:signal transduction histidine kinase
MRAPEHADAALVTGVPGVFDEILRALRLDAGLPDTPPETETAGADLGRARQRDNAAIALVAYGIGAISDSIGELGAESELSFTAREYQVFNQGIDASTASAIEEYQKYEREDQRLEHSKRLGFLGHEIRNALASALMSYATLKKGVMGINSRTGDVMGRSLFAIQNLVNQALAAVQLEAHAPVVSRSLQINSLFLQLEATAIPERGVVVQWIAPARLSVHADERLLSSAIGNLVQNALKFSRPGSLVMVRARRDDASTVIEVEDQCGGLAPGSEESLLAPFAQRGDNRHGLGLGLPIVREAVEAQGGRLTITNLPGKGCIFRVTLPDSASAP